MGGGNLGVGCGRCIGSVGSSGLDVHEQLRKCKGWGELTILRHCSALPIPSLLFALANPSCRAQHPCILVRDLPKRYRSYSYSLPRFLASIHKPSLSVLYHTAPSRPSNRTHHPPPNLLLHSSSSPHPKLSNFNPSTSPTPSTPPNSHPKTGPRTASCTAPRIYPACRS